MKWLVCRDKRTGELFVSTREARETFLESCAYYDAKPRSFVEKTFLTPEEADDYIFSIRRSEELLKSIFG